MALFDKVSGSYAGGTSTTITDSSAEWTINQYQNWFVTILGTEYLIESNTSNTLTFSNSVATTGSYEIAIVGRTYLTEIESDCSNSTKIPDALILKKYKQSNTDLDNKVFAYLRHLCKTDFDPLTNILNVSKMQRPYAYYMLYLIYTDLTILKESFDTFKTDGFYEQYRTTVKDSLALLQIDFNQDGEANCDETKTSAGGTNLIR